MQTLLNLVAHHPEAFAASELPCCLRVLLETAEPAPRDSRPELVPANDDSFRDKSPGGRTRLRKVSGWST